MAQSYGLFTPLEQVLWQCKQFYSCRKQDKASVSSQATASSGEWKGPHDDRHWMPTSVHRKTAEGQEGGRNAEQGGRNGRRAGWAREVGRFSSSSSSIFQILTSFPGLICLYLSMQTCSCAGPHRPMAEQGLIPGKGNKYSLPPGQNFPMGYSGHHMGALLRRELGRTRL